MDTMEDMNRFGGFTPFDGKKLICAYCNIETEVMTSDISGEELSRMHILISPFCPNVKELSEFEKMRRLCDTDRCVDAGPVQNENNYSRRKIDFAYAPGFYPSAIYRKELQSREILDAVGLPIEAQLFLDAGFFYNSPPRDKVTCFWCDGSLDGWKADDDPLKEHAKYYPGCVYLRQIIGTDEIYNIRRTMSPREETAAGNLRYSMNCDILYEYYPEYMDIDTRVRSLIYGEFTEPDANLLALQGFHYSDDDDRKRLKCYYCGLDVPHDINLETVPQTHTEMSPQCYVVRGIYNPQQQIAPDYERILKCFPCKCSIEDGQYDAVKKVCPKPNCGKRVALVLCIRRQQVN